ncbi:putative serine protease [Paramagnetospirillum magnetotacticum MS-1]|uniref:Putative serine protease n=1 Tax=Paramagnetospirillum magnetotacticum MS-1 TaxID=272627 RepID=A0A0C2YJT0_PARME|nr:trypsin-like peptidase domain-containing protein [Paramagnetospirillum magnetotacticum]KIM00020.1 putative serine protease [Paramagnetospirillum magnetotacticum MS-1]
MSSRWVQTVAIVIAMGGALPVQAACLARPSSTTELAQCSTAAASGDGIAARLLGDVMGDPTQRHYDPATALAWWEQAAATGDGLALRRLFDAHWYGRGTPKDPAKARTYLAKAVAAGAQWARLARAVLAEGEEPSLAADLYNGLAAEGNCLAQLRLAHGHDRGGWVEKNRNQAFYWASVAGISGRSQPAPEDHPLFDNRFHYRDCTSEAYFLREELGRGLAADLRGRVEESAAAWKPGRIPERQGPVEAPPAIGVAPVGLGSGAAPRMPEWRPLAASLQRPPSRARLGAEDVFAQVGRSVYVVIAARTEEDLKARNGRFGSAVAMDERTLVTNCHVIDEMAVILLRQGSQTLRATPSGGDPATDRCLMSVSPGRLSAVPGIRPWDDLRVGETVYSIGAPKGLEATLGQGLISGLRPIKTLHYVQTSAPISPGSSGGGLFDAAGNLVGITTFHIRDADGLNFAIAAEDFFR